MLRLVIAATVMCCVLSSSRRAAAVGPPVLIEGTIDLADQTFTDDIVALLDVPVNSEIDYENTDRLELAFDFADMKQIEIADANQLDVTVGLLFQENRNLNADISVRIGFTNENGELVGGLIDLPFESSDEKQIGAVDPSLSITVNPLIFHEVKIIAETTHSGGLFETSSFSFADVGGVFVVVRGVGGEVRVVPEPSSMVLCVAIGLGVVMGVGRRTRCGCRQADRRASG